MTPAPPVPSTPFRPVWWDLARTAVIRLLAAEAGGRIAASSANGSWPEAWAEERGPGETGRPQTRQPTDGADSTPDASRLGRALPHLPGPMAVPRHRLLLLVRLAATLGSPDAVDRLLSPGALTVLDDVPADDLDGTRELLEFVMPASCTIASVISRLATACLMTCSCHAWK